MLALRDAAETVEVTASVGTVETDTTFLGTAIRQEILDNLSLKGRSSLFMFALTPGVVNNRYGEDTRPNDTITNILFAANGASVAATEVFVDGVANTGNVNHGVISWDVPAGRRALGTDMSRVFDAIVGGWNIAIFNPFQSGFPLSFGVNQNTLFLAGPGAQRPNSVGDPLASISGSVQDRLLRYFNTAAFAQPPNFAFGNAPARASWLRNQGVDNWNLTLTKTFSVTERLKVNLRGSSFNLMNHPVFSSGPGTTFGVAQFCQANMSRQREVVLKILF